MQTDVTLPFADGEYRFRLTIPQVSELQRKTGAGIGPLFARVIQGWYLNPDGEEFGNPVEAGYHLLDLIETIRLGLIGGGGGTVNGEAVRMTDQFARDLMADYVFPARPLSEAWKLAKSILSVAVEGWEDPKKKEPDDAVEATADGSTTPAPSVPSPSADTPSSMLER